MPSSPDSRLLAAYEADDLDGIAGAIRDGADPNTKVGGMPLLMYAAGNGSVALVRELLDLDADVDARREPGRETALMYVVSLGCPSQHDTIREMLLDRGASLTAYDKRGHSVLDFAIGAERLADAEALVTRGARCSKAMSVQLERLRRCDRTQNGGAAL